MWSRDTLKTLRTQGTTQLMPRLAALTPGAPPLKLTRLIADHGWGWPEGRRGPPDCHEVGRYAAETPTGHACSLVRGAAPPVHTGPQSRLPHLSLDSGLTLKSRRRGIVVAPSTRPELRTNGSGEPAGVRVRSRWDEGACQLRTA